MSYEIFEWYGQTRREYYGYKSFTIVYDEINPENGRHIRRVFVAAAAKTTAEAIETLRAECNREIVVHECRPSTNVEIHMAYDLARARAEVAVMKLKENRNG
jgi:hypothetical protein